MSGQPALIPTYHSCSYSNDSDEDKWYQNIAHCYIPVRCDRRWRGAVHCICWVSRFRWWVLSAGALAAGSGPPLYLEQTLCAAALSRSSPLVYASSPSFMWLPHGVTALPNQCEIHGKTREKRFVFCFFCKQRTLRLTPTRTSCWNARFLATRRNVTLQRDRVRRKWKTNRFCCCGQVVCWYLYYLLD